MLFILTCLIMLSFKMYPKLLPSKQIKKKKRKNRTNKTRFQLAHTKKKEIHNFFLFSIKNKIILKKEKNCFFFSFNSHYHMLHTAEGIIIITNQIEIFIKSSQHNVLIHELLSSLSLSISLTKQICS